MKNTGKIFESDWKNSVNSEDCLLIRLNDPAQAFKQSSLTRFSLENLCDYICYNTKDKNLYLWELKTTCGKSMSFQTDKDDKSSKLIKWHQIDGLTKSSIYDGVVSGFILNFRQEDESQLTYFIDIKNFNRMKESIEKKSFNIMDIILYGAVRINGTKKRTRYVWDVEELFENIKSKESKDAR